MELKLIVDFHTTKKIKENCKDLSAADLITLYLYLKKKQEPLLSNLMITLDSLIREKISGISYLTVMDVPEVLNLPVKFFKFEKLNFILENYCHAETIGELLNNFYKIELASRDKYCKKDSVFAEFCYQVDVFVHDNWKHEESYTNELNNYFQNQLIQQL